MQSFWMALAISALWAVGAARPAQADGFTVQDARTSLVDGVYYLTADVDYNLSDQLLEALQKGVPLTLKLDIVISRARSYMWDEEITTLEQHYQLAYHALSEQYLVKNLNSGSQYSFPSLEVALTVLGTVVDLPILDKNLLEEGEVYSGRLRAELDVDALPVPLRLLTYISRGWRLSSAWYSWPLQD